MTIIEEITAERQRQIEKEGWSAEHDDRHEDGEMLLAAVIYLHHDTARAAPMREDGAPLGWPWDAAWWKPKDRHRNLVRAGALCVAERERLERAGKNAFHVGHKLDLVIEALTPPQKRYEAPLRQFDA